MERDTSSDRGGEQAVWRDLVARLELPPVIDPANAPWPDRENLMSDRAGRGQEGAAGGPDGASRGTNGATLRPDGTGTEPGRAGQQEPERYSPRTGHDKNAQVSRRRVIRRATFLRADASQVGEANAGWPGQAAGRNGLPAAPLPREDVSRSGNDRYQADQTRREPGAGSDHVGPEVFSRGLDFQDLADLEFSDGGDGERYVPPAIPPQPRLDPVARGAWTALFGGPGYLFLATTLSWNVPGWAELAAIIAFIAGFVVLVSRLGDGPSRKDGPDQGAVV